MFFWQTKKKQANNSFTVKCWRRIHFSVFFLMGQHLISTWKRPLMFVFDVPRWTMAAEAAVGAGSSGIPNLQITTEAFEARMSIYEIPWWDIFMGCD